jgi:peptidoglycan/LPS O-acetylase OafA/YrhL
LFWPLIVAAILFLALRAAQPEPGVLRARGFIWLGDISYALYLVHAPVLMVCYALAHKLSVGQSQAGLVAIGFVGLAASLVTAHIAHMLIERPAQRWIVGIGRRDLPAIA